MVDTRIALPLYRISSALARARYFVGVGRYVEAHGPYGPVRRPLPRGPRTRRAGCRSAMHKRALPKDYDYFIALYARVVKFTCHFNNWLPADAGLWLRGERGGECGRSRGRRQGRRRGIREVDVLFN